MNLKIGISGLRGVLGETLTPRLINDYVSALGTLLSGNKVIVGMDPRNSSPLIKKLVTGSLISTGCKVEDIGITTTPTLEILVPKREATAGIMITASHNPIEWNGLKFFNENGEYISENTWSKLEQLIENRNFSYVPATDLQEVNEYKFAAIEHLKEVITQDYVDVDAIRKEQLKIVYDGGNGGGVSILPELFEFLDCEVVTINDHFTGNFGRPPEPVPENLGQVADMVSQTDADMGLATDPDADRLAVISEEGEPVSDEYTLAIAIERVLSISPGDVVVNLSTSNVIDYIADSYSCDVHRTPVGEYNVVEGLKENDGVVGGEGNGGVILSSCHYGRDSVIGAALVLSELVHSKLPLSEYLEQMPDFCIEKTKFSTSESFNLPVFAERIIERFSPEKVDKKDGYKLILRDKEAWVHVRESNTEPVVRVIIETPTKSETKKLKDTILGISKS